MYDYLNCKIDTKDRKRQHTHKHEPWHHLTALPFRDIVKA
jgi:hypothetical protein